jgi:hypothetical protein
MSWVTYDLSNRYKRKVFVKLCHHVRLTITGISCYNMAQDKFNYRYTGTVPMDRPARLDQPTPPAGFVWPFNAISLEFFNFLKLNF